MAESLAEFEDAKQLDLLQQCWNLSAMLAACQFGVANNLISHQKYHQIAQWVAERTRTDAIAFPGNLVDRGRY